MNKKVSEIIAEIKHLPQDEKREIFKILFEDPISERDLELIKWTIDGIQEAKSVNLKLDQVIQILDNAKTRT